MAKDITLDLGKRRESCFRPRIRAYLDTDSINALPSLPSLVVSLSIGELMGQQNRHINMSPDEARELAAALLVLADTITLNQAA